MRGASIAVLSLLVAVPASAAGAETAGAGFRIAAETLEVRGGEQRTHSGIVSFDGQRIRLEDAPGLVDPVWHTVIYRADRDLVWSLDDADRAYVTPFEIVPLQSLELLDQLDGFPIRVRWSENGRITSEIRVTSIEPLEAVDVLFEPPAEFRRRPGFAAPAAGASAP